MATLTQHAPGTFSWPELGTSNVEAAKSFYSSVFGWTAKDMPMPGDGGAYTIFTLGGRDVCACYTLNPKMQADMPPYWGVYVTVENAATTAKRAAELGGTIMAEPFDVMDLGRMAILQDPTGAMFCVWQPMKHVGAGVLDETGALCWTELMTPDAPKAGAFYQALFGWKANEMPMGPAGMYTVFQRADGANAGGMMPMTADMQGIPPHWTNYFQVTDVVATTDKVKSLGGTVIVPPSPVPNVGSFAMYQDPQGAVFAVLQPSM